MRTYPEDESDQKELARLNAEPWMVEQLKLNPEYVHWGPHEDYMGGKPDEGWRSPILKDTWTDLIGKQPELPEGLNEGFTLDELNEVVHFYFHLNTRHYRSRHHSSWRRDNEHKCWQFIC